MAYSEIRKLLFTPSAELKVGEKKRLPVRAEDVCRFLQCAGSGHRNYFQYTTIAGLKGLLTSKKLYLTLGSELNDKVEVKTSDSRLWRRSYIASFSFGEPENVAMWKMYGESEENSVRIGFNGKSFANRIATLGRSKVGFFRVVSDGLKTDRYEELGVDIESVSLHDVIYQYGQVSKRSKHGSVLWNRMIANDARCSEFDNCGEHKEFATFVKDCAWSYENETRVVVVLKKELPKVKRIAVDISDVLKTLRVLSGPCYSKEAIIKAILRNKHYATSCFKQSSLDVDFRSRRERLA